MDNDLKEFNENLKNLNESMRSYWPSLVKGILTGFGSVLGAGLAILLIGWFLNVIGVIPAFQKQADQWRQIFLQNQNSQTYVSPEGSGSQTPAE